MGESGLRGHDDVSEVADVGRRRAGEVGNRNRRAGLRQGSRPRDDSRRHDEGTRGDGTPAAAGNPEDPRGQDCDEGHLRAGSSGELHREVTYTM